MTGERWWVGEGKVPCRWHPLPFLGIYRHFPASGAAPTRTGTDSRLAVLRSVAASGSPLSPPPYGLAVYAPNAWRDLLLQPLGFSAGLVGRILPPELLACEEPAVPPPLHEYLRALRGAVAGLRERFLQVRSAVG